MAAKTQPFVESNTLIGQQLDDVIERAPILERVGGTVADSIWGVVQGRKAARRIADFLHGVWLGHPLHPVLTDVTIGSWVSGAILDAASLATDNEGLAEAADTMTAVGTVSAVGTAITGLNDYSRISNHAVRHGALHGLLNATATTFFAISVLLRKRGDRKAGIMLSLTGLGIATISAWMGGDMVYRHRVGTNHARPVNGLQEWTKALKNDELLEIDLKRVDVEGNPILLYRRYGKIYAIGAVCSHAGGPLEEGTLDGHYCVECPWHNSVFDLRDGKIVHGPATSPEPTFEARVMDGWIEVRAAEEYRTYQQR